MRSMRVAVCAGACAAAMSAGGCALLAVGAVAAAAGVGTYAYMNGKLESTETASLDETYGAALAAVESMEFDVKRSDKDALEGRIVSERVNGQSVTIRMFREDPELTRLTIRVGSIGDEDVSLRVLDEIKSRLPAREVAEGGESNGEMEEVASVEEGVDPE